MKPSIYVCFSIKTQIVLRLRNGLYRAQNRRTIIIFVVLSDTRSFTIDLLSLIFFDTILGLFIVKVWLAFLRIMFWRGTLIFHAFSLK